MTATQTKIVLLGTGTPNAEPDRAGSALAIIAGDRPYLVDFGPGVVRRATAATQAGITALAMPRLTRAFLTHLHSDHTAGYPDLILTPWVLGRDQPLHVYGPSGLHAMTEYTLAAHAADIRERLEGLEPANTNGYQVKAKEIGPGSVYMDTNVQVEAFGVSHGSWPAFGYRFTTPDRTIVVSGDTAPIPELIDHYRGCDVLIHEVYSTAGLENRPPEWRHYHANVHTSTAELAAIASQIRPELLILVHQLYWGVTDAMLLAEIRALYDGEVMSGKDLDVY